MGLGTTIADIGEKVKSFTSSVLSIIVDFVKSNTKIAMIIVGAFLVIIFLLLVLAIVSHTGGGSGEADTAELSLDSNAANEAFFNETPPGSRFFLPYEPNFVPDVLLEREPRDGWTEEDARPFWTDPLQGNESFWRRRIESGIDSLLEHVP